MPIEAVPAPILQHADTRTSKDVALEDGVGYEGAKSSSERFDCCHHIEDGTCSQPMQVDVVE